MSKICRAALQTVVIVYFKFMKKLKSKLIQNYYLFTFKEIIDKVKSRKKRHSVPFSEKGTLWQQMRNRRRIVDTCLLIHYRRR